MATTDLTNYAEDLVARSLGGFNPTMWSAAHVGLISAVTDGEAGTVTELTGNNYGRVQLSATNFSTAASGGTIANDADIDFPTATGGAWLEATHFGIWDATAAGNLLAWEALTTAKTVAENETFTFAIGDLTIDGAAGSSTITDTYANIIANSLAGRTVTWPTVTATGLASDGTPTELANSNGYARVALSTTYFPASATNGVLDNDVDIVIGPASGGDWTTATHSFIADSATYGGGNILSVVALGASKTVQNGDDLTYAATGGFTITVQ